MTLPPRQRYIDIRGLIHFFLFFPPHRLTFALQATPGFADALNCYCWLQPNSVHVSGSRLGCHGDHILSFPQTEMDRQQQREGEGGMSGSQRSTLKQRATQMDLGPQG